MIFTEFLLSNIALAQNPKLLLIKIRVSSTVEFSITLRHWQKEANVGITIIHVEVELSKYWVLVEILPRVTVNVMCTILITFTIHYVDHNGSYLLSYLCAIPWRSVL